ncbi:MAG: hypothetical protein U0325_26035 [Polyangiales bacterium]
MSLPEQPYRASAGPALGAPAPRRVTRAQVALILVASLTALGAMVWLAPRAPSVRAPRVVPAEGPFRSGPLPLPPVVRAAPSPRTPPRAPRVTTSFAKSGLAEAQACLQPARAEAEVRACIVNALRTRASTEPERRLLCVTYIDQEDRGGSEACMRDYVQRHPETRWASEFRARLRGE